MKYSNKFR